MGAGNAGRSSAGAAWTFNCWTISPASKRTFSFRRNSCAPVSHLHLVLSLSLWSSTFPWRLTPAFDGSLNYFYPLVSKKNPNQTLEAFLPWMPPTCLDLLKEPSCFAYTDQNHSWKFPSTRFQKFHYQNFDFCSPLATLLQGSVISLWFCWHSVEIWATSTTLSCQSDLNLKSHAQDKTK